MANNIKKDRILVKAWYFGVLLCVVAVLAALLINGFSDNQYNMEKEFAVKIKSEKDLVKLGESIYNNTLVLQNDIHITNSEFSIGSHKHPFQGTFDGNGYSVIFDFETVGDNYSFFEDITEDAVIVNTTFDFGKLKVTGSSFSGIVHKNHGHIEDCKVKFDNLVIDNTGSFSPFVVYNYGDIFKCVASGTIKNEKLSKEQEKSVEYGNFSVYNYGSIENIVAIVRYENFLCTDEQKVFAQETDNKSVSIITPNSGGTIRKALAVVTSGNYFTDGDHPEIEFYNNVNEALVFENIMDDLDFNNRIWEIKDGDLRTIGSNGVHLSKKKAANE